MCLVCRRCSLDRKGLLTKTIWTLHHQHHMHYHYPLYPDHEASIVGRTTTATYWSSTSPSPPSRSPSSSLLFPPSSPPLQRQQQQQHPADHQQPSSSRPRPSSPLPHPIPVSALSLPHRRASRQRLTLCPEAEGLPRRETILLPARWVACNVSGPCLLSRRPISSSCRTTQTQALLHPPTTRPSVASQLHVQAAGEGTHSSDLSDQPNARTSAPLQF